MGDFVGRKRQRKEEGKEIESEMAEEESEKQKHLCNTPQPQKSLCTCRAIYITSMGLLLLQIYLDDTVYKGVDSEDMSLMFHNNTKILCHH